MLKALNISFSRGTRVILDNVDFELHTGEVVGIVGKNGEGKSTLLNILAGLEKSTSGTIQYDEKSIGAYTPKELRQKRTVLSQNFSISFNITVYDFLLMSKRLHGKLQIRDFESVDEIIRKFDLQEFLLRPLTRLSGGELQRVLFAKALLQIYPFTDVSTYMFLDEPTSALDLEIQQVLLGTLREIAQTNKVGIVAVLHDLNQATHYCDRICVISDKKIRLNGTPNEVVTLENIQQYFKVKANIINDNCRPVLTI